MNDRLNELQACLPGLHPGLGPEYEKLAEVFQHQVFELYPDDTYRAESGTPKEACCDYYIPYMMNDALECYLVLERCRMTGTYFADYELEAEGELVQDGERTGLVIRQRKGEFCNAFTLWFRGIHQVLQCYQYHRIGHFWVTGQEQWRQLVYMIGTIYDKYEYMGKAVCNEKELELMDLIGFAPFRHWSPISDSLEEKYPETAEGMGCMRRLAREAGDLEYERLVQFYKRMPNRWMEKQLSRKLLDPGREPLYQLIWNKLREASEAYEERRYPKPLEQEIKEKRKEVHRALAERGFRGQYPKYWKEEQHGMGSIWILAVEEHPFTRMEAEDYAFRIQFMVSEFDKSFQGKAEMNGGFFRGKGRRGWIADDLKFLEMV